MKITRIFIKAIINFCIFSGIELGDIQGQHAEPAMQQADSVLGLLNLEDCINLISGSEGMQAPGIPKMNIPPLKMTDGPHGPHFGKAPALPVGVAMAATWDTALVYEAGRLIGKCTRAQGRNTLLGPCVNIHRVPTGGRNFESYSEDPWLASRMAVSLVRGLQGENVIPTVKHFALNNNEWNRHQSNVNLDERTMREIYLPAFEAAVKEAGAWGIMTSYNKVRGLHASEQDYLLGKVLKEEWGFKGIVVSDWASVYSTVGPANAGLDIEMPFPLFYVRDSIMKYISKGLISRETIKEKARRNLYVRFAAGLFNTTGMDSGVLTSDTTNHFIRQVAEEGITLLKNENNILPLSREKIKSIAVIGPNAAVLRSGGGGSSYIDPFYSVSPLDGIIKAAGDKIRIQYAAGDTLDHEMISPVVSTCFLQPDAVSPGLLAEYFSNATLTGEPAYKCVDSSINFTWHDQAPAPGMARRTYSVRWQGFIVPGQTGWHILKFQTNNDGILYIDNVAAIDRMGRLDPTPLMMRKYLEAGRKYAIRLEIFVPGSGGQAILGWIPPVAKEPDFDKIDQAVVIAEESDVAVICVGWDKMYETEGYDKDEGITLPGHQEELIRKVAAVNPNTIVIINSGTPVLMDGWEPAVKGLMLAYYPGHEGGNALASLLFGEVSPSGKLPFTFIADSSQAPAFRNYMSVNPTIRYEEGLYIGYRYIDKNRLVPRYPFGYGLSYTTFSMGKPSVKALGNNNFRISLMVKNTGCMAGKEVVQVYVSDQNPGVEKPVKELKAFSKVMLQPGEEKEVNLVLSSRAFAYYNAENRKWTTEPGKYTLLIGNSSQNILQRTDLKIN